MPDDNDSSSSVKGRIKRPGTVTAAAVVLLVGSALFGISNISAIILSFRIRPTSVLTQPDELPRALHILPQLIVAAWGIGTAIGVFRLRRWARISMIVISVGLAYLGLGNALMGLVLPTPSGAENAWIPAVFRGVSLTFFGLGGLGALWIAQFSGTSADQLFDKATTARDRRQSPEAPSPSGKASSVQLQASRSISTMVTATWLIGLWPLTLISVLLGFRRLLPFPQWPFGATLHGSFVITYHIAFTICGVAAGVGLMRGRDWSRVGAIALSVFTILSTLGGAIRPGAFEASAAQINRSMNGWISQPTYWVMVLWDCVLPAAAIWFLITRWWEPSEM